MSANIKTWQARMQEVYGLDSRGFKPDEYMMAEIADLRAALDTDRRDLQSDGHHPAPCARHCEAMAFNIEIRRLKHELYRTMLAAAPAPGDAP